MAELSYAGAAIPVRADLPDAHRRAWQRLARAGNWWTGAERVAIAAEARNASRCPLCQARKASLSPYTVPGAHSSVGQLPGAAIDVIHRVVTDPGRLTQAWFSKTMECGEITDGQYVEIIDVLVTVIGTDSFCRGVGVAPHPLPRPQPGAPSRYRPATAKMERAWVAMIAADQAIGDEADLWGEGRASNVIRALSLVPDAVRQLIDLSDAHYVARDRITDFSYGRSLSRPQMELVAARVSALRGCFY